MANQTWKNESEANAERGWLLMANCMSAFPPSKVIKVDMSIFPPSKVIKFDMSAFPPYKVKVLISLPSFPLFLLLDDTD